MPRSSRFPRYSATLDRELVHKSAVSEVLLTDHAEDDGRYRFAAQLPTSHAYYNDRPLGGGPLDPLALVEACRQAAEVTAYTYLGVDRGTRFLIAELRYDFSEAAELCAHQIQPDGAPPRLVIDGEVQESRVVAGRLRSARLRFTVRVLDAEGALREVGALTGECTFIPARTYDALRARAAVTRSTELTGGPSAGVAPARVGRTLASNVVLSEDQSAEPRHRMQLRLPVENRSMFDHVQDHVPAMVIMEAARQLSVLTGTASSRAMFRADARFTSYTELGAPGYVESRAVDERTMEVRIVQNGGTTAELQVRVGDGAPQ